MAVAQWKNLAMKNIWRALPASAKKKLVVEIAKKNVAETLSKGKATFGNMFYPHAKNLNKTHLRGVEAIANTKNVGDVHALTQAYEKAYGKMPEGVKKMIMQGYTLSPKALKGKEKLYENIVRTVDPQITARQLGRMDPFEASRYVNNYERLARALPSNVQQQIF